MTGVGAGDAGPTGDLQVLLDEPRSAQVGLQHSNWAGVSELRITQQRQSGRSTMKHSGYKILLDKWFLAQFMITTDVFVKV